MSKFPPVKISRYTVIFFRSYSVTYFKISTREDEIHNYLSFGRLFCQLLFINEKGGQMTNNCEFHVLLLIFYSMKFVTGYD